MRAECPWCKSRFDAHRAGRIFCPNCGAEMELPEPLEVQEVEPPPWERMEALGFWRAFADTWKGASLEPTRFFSRLAPGPLLPPFLYALLVGTVGHFGVSIWATLFLRARSLNLGHWMGDWVGAAVGQAVGIWILAGVVHLGCLLFGCAAQGFAATFRVVAYAAGPAILGILPGGSLVGGIWSMVLMIIGLRWVQRTTSLRAALAVLVLPLALTVLLVGLVLAALIVTGLGAAWLTSAGGGWPT